MEKCGKDGGLVSRKYTAALSACSSCAGDYEDPDRTARPDEEADEEKWEEEDFPVEEETPPE